MSSCKKGNAIIGRVVDQSTPALVQGADLYVVAQLVFDGTREPYAIANFTGASAQFPAAAGGAVTIPGTLVSADLGTLRFDLAASGSSALAVGDPLSFQVELVDARGKSIVILEDALTVAASLFP
jgi:hypothetical protein